MVLQSFHGLGKCSYCLSIVLALLHSKCSHQLLIQDISVVFICWILSYISLCPFLYAQAFTCAVWMFLQLCGFGQQGQASLSLKIRIMNVFSATRQINSPQGLRVFITIFPSVSENNAASGRVYFDAPCVHQKGRHSMDSSWQKHARESAKVWDKVKTVQCIDPVNDMSERT